MEGHAALLHALGLGDEEILGEFYNKVTFLRGQGGWQIPFTADAWRGQKPAFDIIDAKTGEVVFPAGQKVSPRAANKAGKDGLETLLIPTEEIFGRYSAYDLVNDATGALRGTGGHSDFGRAKGLLKGEWEPLWVVDFPMFEYDDAARRWNAVHHPFTSPNTEWIDRFEEVGRFFARLQAQDRRRVGGIKLLKNLGKFGRGKGCEQDGARGCIQPNHDTGPVRRPKAVRPAANPEFFSLGDQVANLFEQLVRRHCHSGSRGASERPG